MLTQSDKQRIYQETYDRHVGRCVWGPSPAERAAAKRAAERAVEDAEEAQRVSDARLSSWVAQGNAEMVDARDHDPNYRGLR